MIASLHSDIKKLHHHCVKIVVDVVAYSKCCGLGSIGATVKCQVGSVFLGKSHELVGQVWALNSCPQSKHGT